MILVLDTNVLVSALWTPSGNASLVLSRVLGGSLQLCYDNRILEEYWDVLCRPRFHFPRDLVKTLLGYIESSGIAVLANPLPDLLLSDEDDRPFYEVAKTCQAPLVTGNLRHFPDDPLVYGLSDFVRAYL